MSEWDENDDEEEKDDTPNTQPKNKTSPQTQTQSIFSSHNTHKSKHTARQLDVMVGSLQANRAGMRLGLDSKSIPLANPLEKVRGRVIKPT